MKYLLIILLIVFSHLNLFAGEPGIGGGGGGVDGEWATLTVADLKYKVHATSIEEARNKCFENFNSEYASWSTKNGKLLDLISQAKPLAIEKQNCQLRVIKLNISPNTFLCLVEAKRVNKCFEGSNQQHINNNDRENRKEHVAPQINIYSPHGQHDG